MEYKGKDYDDAERIRDEGMKKWMKKKYPMTYEEYEKRVIELFLEPGTYTATKKEKLEFIYDELLKNDPDFIRNQYNSDCKSYDNPEKYGIVDPEYIFSDERLDAIPVYNLELLF